MGNTPQWGVAHPPGGQRPISLEYQIYLPAIDSIVTGMQEIRLICGQRENGASEANAQDLRREALQVIIGRRSVKMKAKTITMIITKTSRETFA